MITEVQPNPTGVDDAEWAELHNTGMVAADVSGWTIQDFAGAAGMPRTYAFPAGTMLAPGQVIIVARQATAFTAMALVDGFAVTAADYELALGADDPLVPNLTASAAGSGWALGNNGDAVMLLDATAMFVSGMEYGNVDRAEIAGTPQTTVAVEGSSYSRIANSGSSNADFTPGAPTPGVGFVAGVNVPPAIANTNSVPRHLRFGDTLVVNTQVTDTDPVTVVLEFATATSSTGPAGAPYANIDMMTSPTGDYTASPPLMFVPPMTFHEQYVRFFVSATDSMNATSTDPANATTGAANTADYQRNLMPSAASPISEAIAEDANEIPLWRDHSVTVEGVALTKLDAFVANRTNFFIMSQTSPDAIRIFNPTILPASVLPGDVVRVTGKIDVINGARQIGEPQAEATILSSGAPIPISTHTVADLLANGEALEGQLVFVSGLSLVTMPANWPSNGNLDATDGTGTITVRSATNSGLGGTPAPQGVFDLVAILGQFSNTGIGGYQLLPRDANDVSQLTPPVDAGIQDAMVGVDGELPVDTGMPMQDSGIEPTDAGIVADSGMPEDSGAPVDLGVRDAAVQPDTGMMMTDSGMTTNDDAGVGPGRMDAGAVIGGGNNRDEGCGCSATPSERDAPASLAGIFAIALVLATRSRARAKR